MAIHSLVKRTALLAASAAVAVTTLAGTASANTQAESVGDGYSDSRDAVLCVQHDINYFNRNGWNPQIAEDGYWGPITKQAVIDMQYKLISSAKYTDGIVGPRTGDLLLSYGDPGWEGKCRPILPTTS
ncbi:peptidoglycan-binding domain-containing protein [Kitasatospora sp. NPDC053057]|uniref:peptidoglycan-binding domain-containing protein n=1 Tax=Kitasatospora sp. NPDC053057 TaxID=3364062 RepID=UPI0037CA274D